MGKGMFQHTAARRRLRAEQQNAQPKTEVSTHSRAEAAALSRMYYDEFIAVSTHSRAEAAAFEFS